MSLMPSFSGQVARLTTSPRIRSMSGMKRMSLAKFGRIVSEVMETLPDGFKPYLENLVVDVEDEPGESILRDQGFTDEDVADGDSLYGLFVPFPQQLSLDDAGAIDDANEHPLHRLIIYKNPLEEDFPAPANLRKEIRRTVIHELAHHFGYSERDLDSFESKEDPWQQ
jgi:predicted Zn-dependent protease with MMP-like domain